MTKKLYDMTKKILLISVLLVATAFSLRAQHLYPFHNRVKGSYNFWLYTPNGYTDTVDKPLVIFLHGRSLCGNNLSRVRRYGPINALEMGMHIDALVLAPQSGGAWKPAKIWSIVEWLEQRYAIDTNRIYVLGMSLGGYGTVDLTAAYPSKIAAAMALCGGGTSRDLCPLNEVPLWILHGTADRAVGIGQSQRVVDAMNNCGDTNRLIWTRLNGMNHGQLVYAFYMHETYNWLFSHSLTDPGRKVNRNFSLTPHNMNRSVYRSIREGNKIIVHSSAPATHILVRKENGELATIADTAKVEVVEEVEVAKTEKSASANKSSQYYTVKKGDNLGSIARKHNTTVKKLCQLNGINANTTLKIGRKLRVK